MMIDVLIKKKETQILKRSMGKIFRKYNIVEYKSPDEFFCVSELSMGTFSTFD